MSSIDTGILSLGIDPFVTTSEGVFSGPIFLAQIDLAAFGAAPARTLRLSTVEYVDPSGIPWEPVLMGQPTIDQGGNFLESAFQPVDAEIVVMDKRITGQAAGETFLDLLADYELNGSTVVFYQAFENLTSTSQFRVIFTGQVEELRDIGANSVKLWCVQDRQFAKIIPPNIITKEEYPYAPTAVLGARKQIVLGDWTTPSTIPTVSAGYEAVQAGVARAAFPCVIVEQESAAGGLTTPRALVSDEDMHTDPVRLMFFESALETYAYSVAAPTITGSGPLYAQIGSYQFYAPCLAIENDASTAVNWQELLRKDKPRTLEGKCELDYDASERLVQLLMPDVPELGTFVGAQVFVWYNKNASTPNHPRFGLLHSGANPDGYADFSSSATSPTTSSVPYGFTAVNVGPVSTGGSGTVTTWADIKNTTLVAEVRAATQTLEIHRLVLLLLYKPQARLVDPGVNRGGTDEAFPRSGRFGARPRQGGNFSGDFSGFRPPTYAYDNPFFAFGKGTPDSGHATAASGHYTGTSGALIEHPCDVVHWALRELGETPASGIVTDLSTHGSFVDARSALASYKMRCLIASEQDVESFVEDVGRQTLTWFFRLTNTVGAPWAAVPWDTTSSANYRTASDLYTFTSANSDVRQGAFKAGRTPSRQVVNAIRLNYDYDPRTRTFGDQLYITPDESRVYSSGFTTDASRVSDAADSAALYGRRELVVNLTYVADPTTASSILTRHFDLRVAPRVILNFTTWINAFDLERGHVIGLSDDWDTFLTFPKPGSDGSWAGKALRVVRVARSSDRPTQYRVVAVEV